MHTRLVWRVCKGILQRLGFVILQGNLRAAAGVVTFNYTVNTKKHPPHPRVTHTHGVEYGTQMSHKYMKLGPYTPIYTVIHSHTPVKDIPLSPAGTHAYSV